MTQELRDRSRSDRYVESVRFILGLDVRHHSQGALRFAAWLATRLEPTRVTAVHVIEHDEAMVLLRRLHLRELLARRRAYVQEALAEAGAEAVVHDVQVVQDTTAEDHLSRALHVEHADGLVIGRSAARDGSSVMRLGRVARRLARSLPGPLVIVPPDLIAEHLGDGPIVCAAAPTPESLDAVRMAIDFGAKLGRPVRLVHAVRIPDPAARADDPAAHEATIAHAVEEAARKLEKWCEAYGLASATRDVIAGDPATVLVHRCAELHSPLLVCGSRRLDLLRRAFTSSLGTHLASYAKIPVLIVPPR